MYALLSFFATVSVYNFQRLYKLKRSTTLSPWMVWVNEHRVYLNALMYISGLIALIGICFVLKNSLLALPGLIFSAGICYIYVVPVFGKNLRDLPYLKSPLIALVWTIILIAFPWVNEYGFVDSIFPEFFAYFYLIYGLTIPFDIRDLKYDQAIQKTMPQVVGKVRSKIFSLLLLALFLSIIAIINEKMRYNFFFIGSIVFSAFLIVFTNDQRKDLFFGLVDASIILIGLSFMI